jgi:hypothetical protein
MFIIVVDALLTAFGRWPFTKACDRIAKNPANPCVLLASIAG